MTCPWELTIGDTKVSIIRHFCRFFILFPDTCTQCDLVQFSITGTRTYLRNHVFVCVCQVLEKVSHDGRMGNRAATYLWWPNWYWAVCRCTAILDKDFPLFPQLYLSGLRCVVFVVFETHRKRLFIEFLAHFGSYTANWVASKNCLPLRHKYHIYRCKFTTDLNFIGNWRKWCVRARARAHVFVIREYTA